MFAVFNQISCSSFRSLLAPPAFADARGGVSQGGGDAIPSVQVQRFSTPPTCERSAVGDGPTFECNPGAGIFTAIRVVQIISACSYIRDTGIGIRGKNTSYILVLVLLLICQGTEQQVGVPQLRPISLRYRTLHLAVLLV